MYAMRAADGSGCGFRKAQVANFPLLHQIRHRAHGVFNPSLGVHAMLIVEVDDFDIQALE